MLRTQGEESPCLMGKRSGDQTDLYPQTKSQDVFMYGMLSTELR